MSAPFRYQVPVQKHFHLLQALPVQAYEVQVHAEAVSYFQTYYHFSYFSFTF